MNSIRETLLAALTSDDKARARSTQTNVGPSEIGGCATQLWHKVNGTIPTNPDTLRLAAIMGTAIHAAIDKAFSGKDGYLTEVELTHAGITGHVDLIDTTNNTIWDWKTTTKGSLPYFGSKQQIEQIQIYGYLANANGYKVDRVGLVAIARDGDERDIVEKVWDYDPSVAEAALARLDAITKQFDAPAPEKDAEFCAKYCVFFGACTGIVAPDPTNVIDNPDIVALADEYVTLQKTKKALDGQMDAIKQALEGTQGTTTSGVVVKWSQIAGRSSVDEEAVMRELGYVPTKTSNPYVRFTVK